jgi:hypothetical protein
MFTNQLRNRTMATVFSKTGGRLGPRHVTDAVGNRSLATLTVAPSTANVAQLATQQYTVTGADLYGAAAPIPATDIAWTVSNVNAGTIDADGLLTAGTTGGTYQVRATHTPSGVYDEANAVVAP